MAGRCNDDLRCVVMVRRGILTFLTCIAMSTAPTAGGGVLACAAGDIAECKSAPQKSAAAQTAKMIPSDAMVFVVGDTTYPFADRATLESCYTPTWGQFLPRTYAVPGNHDYGGDSPNDFLDYFGARTPHRTWFRAEVGDWWVIGLDSNVSGAGLEEQQAWLEE